MDQSLLFVLLVVVVALIFDFINGFHDSANSIATVVATRVLSPGVAVMFAAACNFIAAFVVGTAVFGEPDIAEAVRGLKRACLTRV